MCGIYCIISSDKQYNIAADLINGLKLLEYRGYDSAGISVLNHSTDDSISNGVTTTKVLTLKAVGEVSNLEAAYKQMPILGYAGIAHTRWATHGGVTINNTHPIIVEDICVVHNGVVENYFELRQELHENYGYITNTQTDTEVISALIHYFFIETQDVFKAVQRVVLKLIGKLSFAMISKSNPEQIICVNAGRQLVIGHASNMNYIASDIIVFPESVDLTTSLEDGDLAIISSDKIEIFNFFHKTQERKAEKYLYQEYKASYDSYAHFMHKEIFEQQQIIQSTIDNISSDLKNKSSTSESFSEIKKLNLKNFQRVHIIACGASFYAGYIGKYLIERECKILTSIDIASEFTMRHPVIDSNTLYIFISQSGETADTISAMAFVKTCKASTLAIVNRMRSPIAKNCDISIPICAGTEQSVAATKTFTMQILVLLLLVMHSKGEEEFASFIKDFDTSSLKITPEFEKQISRVSHQILHANRILYIGRDILYPICLEGALKIKEIGYIAAEAIPAGEIKHGPIALVDAKTPIIILAPYSEDEMFAKLSSNIQEIHARKGKIILITCKKGAEALMHLGIKNIILMPQVHKEMLPITYAIPLQLLAYHYALNMGYNIDKPRNLAKSVTVE